MRSVLGCNVSQSLFERWTSLLVHEHAPFFLTNEAQSLLPKHVVQFTRTEFNHVAPNLEYCDSYTTWAVHRDGTRVAFLAPAEFCALHSETRHALLALQWQLGRGQVYDAVTVWPWLTPDQQDYARSYTVFASPESDKVALDYALWRMLSCDTQWRWLTHFIAHDRSDCLSELLDADQWNQISSQIEPHVRQLAGSFAWSSGANCFSTTVAAATRSPHTAATIASLWLAQAPFLRSLAARGYIAEETAAVNEALPAGAVLVWVDTQSVPQHACIVLGNGLVLNKDSQTWYAPRQIRSLNTVLQQWQADGFAIQVYTRCD